MRVYLVHALLREAICAQNHFYLWLHALSGLTAKAVVFIAQFSIQYSGIYPLAFSLHYCLISVNNSIWILIKQIKAVVLSYLVMTPS